jgi:hypothetical protein
MQAQSVDRTVIKEASTVDHQTQALLRGRFYQADSVLSYQEHSPDVRTERAILSSCKANQKDRPSPSTDIVNRVVTDIPAVEYVSVSCDVTSDSRFAYRNHLYDFPVESTFVSPAPAAANDMEVKRSTVQHFYCPDSTNSLTNGYSKHFPMRFQPLLLPELLNDYGFYPSDVFDDIANLDTSITV